MDESDGEHHDGGGTSIQQKLEVSREMTSLLERRLKEMRLVGQSRIGGLVADDDEETEETYALIESRRLRVAADALSRDLKPTRTRSPTKRSRAAAAAAAAAAASASGGLDFGGDSEEDELNVSTSMLRASRRKSLVSMEVHERDAGVMDRLHRELHKSEATHIHRMVDNIVLSIDEEPPFVVPVDLVLKFVGYRINVPYSQKFFRFYLCHPLSQAIVQSVFWFIHCRSFQSGSEVIQEALVQSISAKFVKLTHKVKQNKHLFFQSFPYAVANAAYASFHYFVPGSRNLYDSQFKLQLYIVTVRLLTGMEVCASAVQHTLERLFPDETMSGSSATGGGASSRSAKSPAAGDDGDDDDDTSSPVPQPEGMSTEALAGVLTRRDKKLLGEADVSRVQTLRGLPPALIVPPQTYSGSATSSSSSTTAGGAGGGSASGGAGATRAGTSAASSPDGDRPPRPPSRLQDTAASTASSGPLDPEVLQPSWLQTESAADVGFHALLRRSKKRQLRTPFCITNVSPLVQRYLGVEQPSIGRPVMLKRTTPVPWSAVGGVDTFRSTQLRTRHQEALLASKAAAAAKYVEDVTGSRKEEEESLKTLKKQASAVLQGGQSARSKFCLFITDELDDRRRRRRGKTRRTPRQVHHSLTVPSNLTSIRAKMPSLEENLHRTKQENPAWANFQASGLGWTVNTAGTEYDLLK